MPLLKRNHMIAINWGLVTGKTNTRYAWNEPHPDGSEPEVWFHDILRPDGSPYIPQEVGVHQEFNPLRIKGKSASPPFVNIPRRLSQRCHFPALSISRRLCL